MTSKKTVTRGTYRIVELGFFNLWRSKKLRKCVQEAFFIANATQLVLTSLLLREAKTHLGAVHRCNGEHTWAKRRHVAAIVEME